MKKLVLTGAAGRLGSYLREPLSKMADELVSTDIVADFGRTYPGERYVQADVGDLAAIEAILEGADMVVHFGAIPDEAPFDDILHSNIVGAYNIWEAAHRNKVRRVIYASSIHAVGMHPKTDRIGADAAHRPDTYYGLSKCFAEDLARMYWDKLNIEAVCLRIMSCANVSGPRSLHMWLSYDDLIQLVQRSVETPHVGFTVLYGVSNNDRIPVDNSAAAFLGYRPKDNAEDHAGTYLADAEAVDVTDRALTTHGGPFATVELGHSGTAGMNIVADKKKF